MTVEQALAHPYLQAYVHTRSFLLVTWLTCLYHAA